VDSDDPDSESAVAAVGTWVLSFVYPAEQPNGTALGDTSGGLLAGWVAAFDFDYSEPLSPQGNSQPIAYILAGAPYPQQ
jgi:hypothetical protein